MKRLGLALLVACGEQTAVPVKPVAPIAAAPASAAAPAAPPARVRFGAIVVSGRVDRDAVVHAIRAQASAFDGCGADLDGRVTAHFRIEKDGTVSNVVTDRASDIDDPAVQACVAKVIQPLRFAPADDVTRVIAPVLYASRDAGDGS